jgi:uncharacterized membrane protein YccC
VTRKALWEAVKRFDRSKIAPAMALRNALGVALPLAVGAAIGDPGGGLIMSTGALNVAFSDGSDPYRHRGRRMLASSLCGGIAVFVGALTGHLHVLAIGEAALCAFVAGMMVAVSVAAADIATVTLIVLVVFSAQDMAPKHAAIAGLLALAGGILQTAFALALWPVRRYGPEGRAMAALYGELARVAGTGASSSEAPPATAQMSAAQIAIEALNGDRSLEAERYLALFSQAERIRLALLAISGMRRRIEPEAPQLGSATELAAKILGAIAASLDSRMPAVVPPDWTKKLRDLTEALRQRDSQPMVRDARWQIEALSGQLRSAVDLAGHTTPAGAVEYERHEAERPWRYRLAGTVALLRANLQFDSATFRHAVRLSVCVVLGTFLGHVLDWRRSYWLPMTIAIILKPDFTSTFSRGVLRLGGTIAGLVLATALFHYLDPGLGVKVAFIALFAFVIRCYGPANYGVLVTALTALIVLMFAVTGSAPGPVMLARGMNTAAGGAIALLAYWLWPTWEQTQISETLARMLDGYRAYFRVVRDAYLDPGKPFAAPLDRARMGARLGRSNLEAAAIRLRSELGASATRLTDLDVILANSHRFIHAAMSLEAGLALSRPVPARDEFRALTTHVDLTLYFLAASLRESSISAADLPDLREDHHALIHSGDPAVERYALVNVETDRITNSLNTLTGEILRWERI